jgi:hypothetical protein
MIRTTARATVAIAALALVLTGCGPGGTPSATPSDTPTATTAAPTSAAPSPVTTPSETPTPTATATATASGCPTWDDASAESGLAPIDFNRFAGICVGMDFPTAGGASGLDIGGNASCPWVADIVADDASGFYVTALSPVDAPGSAITFFRMAWLNDPATASSYEMPGTAEDITIGSTLAQLKAAYPSATEYKIDDYARGPRDEWVVLGPDGNNYIFDIQDGLVSELNWGQVQSTGIQGEYCAL